MGSSAVNPFLGIDKPAARYGLVANYATSNVTPLDFASPLAPVASAAVAVGTHPMGIAVALNGMFALVPNFDSNTVSVLDLANPMAPVVVATVTVGTNPRCIAISSNGRFAIVGNFGGGNVTPIDLTDWMFPMAKTPVTVGTNPRGIAISPDCTFALIGNYGSNNVTPLDLTDPLAPIAQTPVSVGTGPIAVVVARNQTFALVSNYASGTFTPLDLTHPLAPVAATAVAVGYHPTGIVITPDSLNGIVVNGGDGNVTPLNLSSPLAPTKGTAVAVGSAPIGASIFDDGRFVLVANNGTNDVSVLNMANPMAPVAGSRVAVGTSPISQGEMVYVRRSVTNTSRIIQVGDIHVTTNVTAANDLAMGTYVKTVATPRRISAVIGPGDWDTQNDANLTATRAAWRQLDGIVPVVPVTGNHDYQAGTDPAKFFGPETRTENGFETGFDAATMSWCTPRIAGHMASGCYSLITVMGHTWLALGLEWSPRDACVAWADGVLKSFAASYPDGKAIVFTHAYLCSSDALYDRKIAGQLYHPDAFGTTPAEGINDGADLWSKAFDGQPLGLIQGNSCVVMVLCGHQITTNRARMVQARPDGSVCNAVMFNSQSDAAPNDSSYGWLREYEIDTTTRTIAVTTFSPVLKKHLTDSANQFAMTY